MVNPLFKRKEEEEEEGGKWADKSQCCTPFFNFILFVCF